MKRHALSLVTCLAVAAVTLAAQSKSTMHDEHKMNQKPAMDTTYVGCLEAGEMAHAFVLTHLMQGDEMKPAMKQDQEKGASAKTTKEAGMATPMLPSKASLNVAPVDVSGYVGHKIAIVGSLADATMMALSQTDAMAHTPVLTVKSVKMLATTCP